MPRKSIDFFNDFEKQLNNLNRTRKKTEKLYDKKLIIRRDIEKIYGGLFLDAVSLFEEFLEDLFVGLSTGKILSKFPSGARISLRARFRNDPIARPIIIGDKYFQWLKYDQTIKKAENFFKNGYPFKVILDNKAMEEINKIRVVRNAVAHKSTFAREAFEKNVVGSISILPRERRVLSWLRGGHALLSSIIITRYEKYIMDLKYVSRMICVC